MASQSRFSQAAQADEQSTVQIATPTARYKVIGAVRVLFGIAWAVAAMLKWEPAFIKSFADTVSGALDGQPPAIHAWIALWSGLVQTNPPLFAYLAALTESLLAICFILGLFTNTACVVGMLWAFTIWSVPEGFGGPFVPGKSTDIGTGFPYMLLSALLLVLQAGLYFGLDRALTARLGRYGFLASGSVQKTRSASPR